MEPVKGFLDPLRLQEGRGMRQRFFSLVIWDFDPDMSLQLKVEFYVSLVADS